MRNLFTQLLCVLTFALRVQAGINGDYASLKAALDAAKPGDTITINAGTYTWTNGQQISIDKPLHLLGAAPGTVKLIAHNISLNLITLVEPASGNIEFANIDLDWEKAGNAWPYMVAVWAPNPRGTGRVLMHDCRTIGNYAWIIRWGTNGGVIYNCIFDGANSNGLHGVEFKNNISPSEWTKVSTLGDQDRDGLANTYVEDCQFIHHASVNMDDNSRVVIRHCVFDNSNVGSHGQETSPEGTRQWDIGHNTFSCNSNNSYNLDTWFGMRGGTGVWHDNQMNAIPSKSSIQMCVFSIRRVGQIPCQVSYPAARQIGQGWKGNGGYDYPSVPRNGTGYFLDPIYFWNNGDLTPGPHEYNPDECHNNQVISNYVKEGRDWYNNTPKPGYAEYTYPHPLRTTLGEGGPTPTPTPQPTPSPTPSPSATPTPTPQPSPPPPSSNTYRNWLDQLGQWIEEHPAHPDP